jgi:hypothetical protein
MKYDGKLAPGARTDRDPCAFIRASYFLIRVASVPCCADKRPKRSPTPPASLSDSASRSRAEERFLAAEHRADAYGAAAPRVHADAVAGNSASVIRREISAEK